MQPRGGERAGRLRGSGERQALFQVGTGRAWVTLVERRERLLEFLDRGGPAGARYVVRAVDASGNLSDEAPVTVAVDRP